MRTRARSPASRRGSSRQGGQVILDAEVSPLHSSYKQRAVGVLHPNVQCSALRYAIPSAACATASAARVPIMH
ncbi:MAG: hypothetical protein ACI9S9_004618, partial [Planctomycetota bacterium]